MEVIVHCSDTPNGRDDSAADIHSWHKAKGWDGIGYHRVIRIDGTIEHGRPTYWAGAHCRGHNQKVGICLIGRDKFTKEQRTALLDELYTLGATSVKGHYQLDSGKTCPNFDVETLWKSQGRDWPVLEVK